MLNQRSLIVMTRVLFCRETSPSSPTSLFFTFWSSVPAKTEICYNIRTVITVSIWGENSILKKDINGPFFNKIPNQLNADTILICPPPRLQQSNFTLVLITVRHQRIEGSANIQIPTFVIIGCETGKKYIFPEMLLITIFAFTPEVAFFVLLTFPCNQNVCHRHLPLPSQLLLCRQKHWGEYKRAKGKLLRKIIAKRNNQTNFIGKIAEVWVK